jgi:membrane protein
LANPLQTGSRMLKVFEIPLSWPELFRRTYKEFIADNCLGLAAQLAYYLLLALVPALVFMLALVSFLPPSTVQQVIEGMSAVAPGEMMQIFQDQINNIARGEHGGLLTFGLLMALWSSSSAIVSISDALNAAYDIEEGRPWWKVRLMAVALTVGLAAFILAAFALVLIGPTLAERIAASAGLGGAFEWTWKILQWPIVFALIAVAIAILNYFGPDADQDWAWISPGAIVATALWLIASLAFKVYVGNFANYNETYGSLGGVIVLMLWFYISSLAILAGAEMNAEIEHASPHGKDPGEKVPGERKKLGARAARAFKERSAPSKAKGRAPAPGQRAFEPQGAAAGERRFAPGVLVLLVTRLFGRSKTRG